MNTRKLRMAALVLAIGLSGTAQAALQGRDLNGSINSFEAYYDTDLNITWLADANAGAGSIYDDGDTATIDSATDGRMTWANANSWAANLSIVDSVNNITYDNWRLPSVSPINGSTFIDIYSYDGSTDRGYNITSPQSEMAYMFDVNLGNPGRYTLAGVVSGCLVNSSDTCLDNVGPFSNLHKAVFWSDIEDAQSPDSAWVFQMNSGYQDTYGKQNVYYAWAVSPGDVATIPEPETNAMMLAGLGLVGAAARRRRRQ